MLAQERRFCTHRCVSAGLDRSGKRVARAARAHFAGLRAGFERTPRTPASVGAFGLDPRATQGDRTTTQVTLWAARSFHEAS
eukprot:15445246-Alexandrium_andersonii.AAC.1